MKSILTILILVTLAVTQAVPIYADGLNSKSILAEINAEGSRKVCNSLYSDEDIWNKLLKNIASGNDEWLQVAVSLRNGADAGASNMLIFAIGEALENDPGAVFRTTEKEISVSLICGGPDIDNNRYNSYELSIQAIDRRINRISSLREEDILAQANECIKCLNDSKASIAIFYNVHNINK